MFSKFQDISLLIGFHQEQILLKKNKSNKIKFYLIPMGANETCPAQHPLSPRIFLKGRYCCGVCQGPIEGESLHSCVRCNWDVCNKCYTEEMQKYTLRYREAREKGQKKIAEEAAKAQFEGSVRCPEGDRCLESRTGDFRCHVCRVPAHGDFLHCSKCKWDVCKTCIKERTDFTTIFKEAHFIEMRKRERYCYSNHDMLNSEFYMNTKPSNYKSSSNFTCAACKCSFPYDLGYQHCAKCGKYDLCHYCTNNPGVRPTFHLDVITSNIYLLKCLRYHINTPNMTYYPYQIGHVDPLCGSSDTRESHYCNLCDWKFCWVCYKKWKEMDKEELFKKYLPKN